MATTTKSYDNEKRIVLFKNDKFGEKDQPVYRGYTWVNGQQFQISIWAKHDQHDKLYYQGQLQIPKITNDDDAVQDAQMEMDEIAKTIKL